MRPAVNECVFGCLLTLLEVSGGFDWASNNAVVSPSCLQIYVSVKILHKCDETSLTVTRIAVSLTLK